MQVLAAQNRGLGSTLGGQPKNCDTCTSPATQAQCPVAAAEEPPDDHFPESPIRANDPSRQAAATGSQTRARLQPPLVQPARLQRREHAPESQQQTSSPQRCRLRLCPGYGKPLPSRLAER